MRILLEREFQKTVCLFPTAFFEDSTRVTFCESQFNIILINVILSAAWCNTSADAQSEASSFISHPNLLRQLSSNWLSLANKRFGRWLGLLYSQLELCV